MKISKSSNKYCNYQKYGRMLSLLFTTGPPVEIVLVSLPFFLVLIVFLCIELIEGSAELCFRICKTTTLTAILTKLGVPFEGSTTFCAIGY